MLLGDIQTLYFSLPCENDNLVITSSSYNIKNKVEKSKITVNIKSSGMINETGCSINLEDPEVIKEYQEKAKKQMYEYTQLAIRKAKQLNSDIFGYGNLIYRKYPHYFNNINDWNKTFAELSINVNIDFNLSNKGALEQTIGELMK